LDEKGCCYSCHHLGWNHLRYGKDSSYLADGYYHYYWAGLTAADWAELTAGAY
jgi:hypothetical protein